jgi:polar amino acid transport system permease protein
MSFWDSLLSDMIAGSYITIQMVVVAIPLSIIVGAGLATARVYGNKVVSVIVTGIVGTFRGISLFVTLLIIFFALPRLGIYFSSFWSAILAFTLVSGAYHSEYIRGAMQSIDIGQSLAAQSLGFTKLKEVIHITLPQALRRALPGISNECIYLILNSSLAAYIGVEEIFNNASTINSLYFRPIETFMVAALIYAAITTAAGAGLRALENKLKIPGLEAEQGPRSYR